MTTRHVMPVEGGEYVAWTSGAGPSVVLLHGWPVTSHRWRHTVPALVAAGRRVIAIDLLGLGESRYTSGSLEKRRIAEDILAIVAGFTPEPYAVVGHDWGGSIALAMAALAPSRITHLVIEEEIPPGLPAALPEPGRSHYPTWHNGFHRIADLPEVLIAGREDAYVTYFLRLRADPSSLSDDDRDSYLAHCRSTSATATSLAYYRTTAADIAFFSGLTPLAVPALTIGGRFAMGAAVAVSLGPVLTQLTHLTLPHSGHYPAEEEPDAFNDAVITFLARAADRPR